MAWQSWGSGSDVLAVAGWWWLADAAPSPPCSPSHLPLSVSAGPAAPALPTDQPSSSAIKQEDSPDQRKDGDDDGEGAAIATEGTDYQHGESVDTLSPAESAIRFTPCRRNVVVL